MSFDDLHAEDKAIIHELILRGLRETPVEEYEYGRAYDNFCEAEDIDLRIGDQPARVRAVWLDIFDRGDIE